MYVKIALIPFTVGCLYSRSALFLRIYLHERQMSTPSYLVDSPKPMLRQETAGLAYGNVHLMLPLSRNVEQD